MKQSRHGQLQTARDICPSHKGQRLDGHARFCLRVYGRSAKDDANYSRTMQILREPRAGFRQEAMRILF